VKSIVAATAGMCALAVGLQAADGVLLVQKTSSGTAAPQTHQIQIEKDRMRTEIAGPATRQAVVFDGTKQTMYMINLDRKTYSEITKADVDRFAAQAQDMMAKMQGQMAAMPPEARAQMEAMMKGRGMGMAAAAKTEYRKSGTDKAGKWTCDKYDGYRSGEKVSEICTVDPSVLGFSAADFAVTEQFMEFFGKLIPQGADQTFTLGRTAAQGFSGLPVKSTLTVGGRTTTTEIVEASRQTFGEAVFAVPAGFQKEPFMGGRGRQ
jgi:hypothetical protein